MATTANRRAGLLAVTACAGALVLFAALSWTAVSGKSATFDESLHLVSAWTHTYLHDYRCDPEDPPLWQHWALLNSHKDQMTLPLQSTDWKQMADDTGGEWQFCYDALFGTPGNDAQALLMRARTMMLFAGVALGAMIAWWSWKLAGPVAAVVATVLFSLDPNFIGHSALMKNDVAISMAFVAVMFAVWSMGRGVTWLRWPCAAVACAIAVNVKFSGVVIVLIGWGALAARALMPEAWTVLGRMLSTRVARVTAAAGLCLGMALVCWAGIWLSYGMRFNLTPDPGVTANLNGLVITVAYMENYSHHPDVPVTNMEMRNWHPGAMIRAAFFCDHWHLLPQTWIFGFVLTFRSTLVRTAYLMGQTSKTGWWYYFPLAMLFKTPVTTLAIMLFAAGIALLGLLRRGVASPARWPMICLAMPAMIFIAMAMSSNLNLGLRHVLPVYPFIYMGIGCMAAGIARWSASLRRAAVVVMAGLAMALAAETAWAYPNYIAFFNVAVGGPRGGLYLLTDSNLDWGQDLITLRRWQEKNPATPLYLCYFGTADPQAYGLRYTDLRSAKLDVGARVKLPDGPGIMAISATHRQGMYLKPEDRLLLEPLVHLQPLEVLGGTIYLYSAEEVIKACGRELPAHSD